MQAGTARPMLEARGIRHAYAGKTVLAVDEWRAAAGEQWLVHGPSGCGKTTLLHILAGLLRPTAGEALVNGRALGALSGGALDRFRGRHVGIVLQRLHLIDALTVRQNLALARRFAGLGAADAEVDDTLRELGIADAADSRPHTLSRGQAQRAALARALAAGPGALLADEPTSSLDDDNAERALALLRARAEARGAALVVASHDRRIRDSFALRLDLSPGAAA